MEYSNVNKDAHIKSSNKRRKLVVTERQSVESPSTKLDGSHFRKLVRGDHPLGALRQLLAVVKNSSDDIISDYLKAGGNVLELVLVLDKIDKDAFFHHYQPVFAVIALVINKCRDEVHHLIPSTEEACKRLLRSNTSILHSMLATSSTQVHKKVVLEMLTAMVTLSVQLAREVLSSLSLREVTMNDLVKHPMKYDPNSVRAHFMRYVLAYFYHDTVHLVKQLLEQRNLLQCIIFAGLTTDEAQLLILLLVTLKEKIVENSSISKTTKLKMFNTKIMIKLLDAYTWKGPDQEKTSSKKGSHYLVSEEEREEVVAYLHQLLVLLCTNHKLGVAFVDPTIGIDQKNYNDLVFSVIKAMDSYWTISLVRDLAVKILNACPDLVAPTFRHFGLQEALAPQVSLSFVHKCEFAKQVIDSLDPERCLSANASPDRLTHLTIRVVLNMNILSCVQASLMSVHPTIRLLAINLLNSVFQTLQCFITSVKTRFASLPKNFIDYNQRIADHITKNIGLEEELMVAWSLGVGGDLSILKVPSELEYYLPLVDLLLSYNQVFPMYLPPVFISKLQNTSLDTIDTESKEMFDIKVIKSIIMFKNIQPSQEEFGDMIKTLVCLLSKHSEAKSVLRSLLMQTGYFEGLECEVDIWVTNLSMFPNCDHHLPLLLSSLSEAAHKPKRCIKMIEQSQTVNDAEDVEEYNWSELIEVANNPTKTLTQWEKMLPYTRLSILMAALVRTLDTEECNECCRCDFITHLLCDILFSQVDISTYQRIIGSCSSSLLQPLKKYISLWNDSEKYQNVIPKPPFKKRTSNNYMVHLYQLELSKLTDVEPEMVPMVVRMLVFHAIRGSSKNDLNYGSLIASLMSKLPPTQHLLVLQEVFLHPLVLENFHPLQPSSPGNLTSLIMSLTSVIGEENHWLVKPYKQRFLEQVQKSIRKRRKMKSPDVLDMCGKLVSTKEEIISLLMSIVEFQPELEEWKEVTTSLLQSATTSQCLLPSNIVTVLSRHSFLQPFLVDYLLVFPHLIESVDIDQVSTKQEYLGKLGSLLLKFDKEGTIQKKLLKNNKKNVQVVFPMLAAVGPLADSTLNKYACQLVSKLCEAIQCPSPPTWICEHSHSFGEFFNQLSEDKCEDLFSSLQSVSVWAPAHVNIAKHVYIRLDRLVDFVTNTLNTLVVSTTPTTLARAEVMCKHLKDALKEVEGCYDWQPVRNSTGWSKWVRLALKLGETTDTEASFLISTLTALCHTVYTQDRSGVSKLLDMIFSHSQFLPVMLAKSGPTKVALLELILTLLRMDSSSMSSSHVPIYLAAYSASLSIPDQLLLQLLQLYEDRGVNLSEWKPLLWGESAASFYSVRSQVAPGLWNRQNFTQLLDLFDQHQVNLTITNFPIERTLKSTDKINDQPEIYDPAFYLPMFVSIFAPSEVFFTYKTCQSGCLALTLSALASRHNDVRTIAFVALQRFHCHLLSNTNNQDTLWLHFLDALRRGLKAEGDEVPRLSSVVTVFLARTSLILTNPSHPLYLPLSQFVLAKPYFQLDTVPELLPLFNSADIQLHNVHQEWILGILRDGMRSKEDFVVCLKSMVFKVILEYYSSTLASEPSKVMILEVLKAAVSLELVKGQSAGQLLVSGYSLFPWLHSVTCDPTLADSLISPLIAVLCALLHKSSTTQLVPLLCHLTHRPSPLTEPQLTAVMAALRPYPLPLATVLHLVDVVDNTVGGVFQHRTMLENGIKYVDSSRKGDSDLRDFLKEVIFTLLKNES